MQGTYYPDLVRAFYFNYKFRDGVGFTKDKGVDIILDDDIWENVAQFPIHDGTSPILRLTLKGSTEFLHIDPLYDAQIKK